MTLLEIVSFFVIQRKDVLDMTIETKELVISEELKKKGRNDFLVCLCGLLYLTVLKTLI